MKTNMMHYLSSDHFVIQPVHVSGILVAHYQEVFCMYFLANRRSTEKHNTYQLLYIYIYIYIYIRYTS
jgi:hypothetical protein